MVVDYLILGHRRHPCQKNKESRNKRLDVLIGLAIKINRQYPSTWSVLLVMFAADELNAA